MIRKHSKPKEEKQPNNILLPRNIQIISLGRHSAALTVCVWVWHGLPDEQLWGNRRPLNRRLHKHPCGATHSLHLPVLLFSCFYVQQKTGTCCTQATAQLPCHALNTYSDLPPDLVYLCPQSFMFSFHWWWICHMFLRPVTHSKPPPPLQGTIDLWRWSWGMWLLFLGPSN